MSAVLVLETIPKQTKYKVIFNFPQKRFIVNNKYVNINLQTIEYPSHKLPQIVFQIIKLI